MTAEDSEEVYPFSLFRIDKIPAQSGLCVEGDGSTGVIRFQAYRHHPEFMESPWTEWFRLEDVPIFLVWQNLWPGGDPLNN